MGGFKVNAFISPSRRPSDRKTKRVRDNQVLPSKTIQPGLSFPQAQAKPLNPVAPSRSLPQCLRRLREFFGSSCRDRLINAVSHHFLGNDQPQVQWWRDAQGHDHYMVYDPHSQKTHFFDTAQAVRAWLERRYYR